MLIKDMTCDDRNESSMDCRFCPFGKADMLKVCTSFKKGKTMQEGLKEAYKKDLITLEKYMDLEKLMNNNYCPKKRGK